MIDFLFNPNGRISRKGYAFGFLLPMIGLTNFLPFLIPGLGAALATIATLFFVWPSVVAVPVKRFHDMGLTGWYQLGFIVLQLLAVGVLMGGIGADNIERIAMGDSQGAMLNVPAESMEDPGRARLGFGLLTLTGIVQHVLFLAVKGQPARNRFGDDPLASGRGFAD
jgi:uncharacterized membrane protein YhaH (DUF805 family)